MKGLGVLGFEEFKVYRGFGGQRRRGFGVFPFGQTPQPVHESMHMCKVEAATRRTTKSTHRGYWRLNTAHGHWPRRVEPTPCGLKACRLRGIDLQDEMSEARLFKQEGAVPTSSKLLEHDASMQQAHLARTVPPSWQMLPPGSGEL